MQSYIEITFITDDATSIGAITQILDTIDVSEAKIRSVPCYDDWKDSLPQKVVPGLKKACLDWIRHWGIGGGDYSSETCIAITLRELNSDTPVELADTIYNSVANYCKSSFDAAALTIEMVNKCIEDLCQT